MRREVEILKSRDLTLDECISLMQTADRQYKRLTGKFMCDACKSTNGYIDMLKGEVRGLQMRGEHLTEEVEKKDKIINSLVDYIAVLQKDRTPIVFTAVKDELKDVQEFIAKHVL